MNKVKNAIYELIENSIAPSRERSLNAGLDITIQDTMTLQPGETHYFRAGVKFRLPKDCYVQVVTRSSTFKKGVVVVPTVVDSNYTDEISTIVTNTSNEPVTVERGWRLAQCILSKWYMFENERIEDMSHDMRNGDEKFGSSGD